MNKKQIEKSIISAHKLVDVIRGDKYRPCYHFCVPFDLGFPADPNAVFYSCGRYHMFYVYESRLDSYRWGNAVSADLLHWSFLSDALFPDETDGGIYSGGVLIDDDGTAIVAYWALGKDDNNGGIRIATAKPPMYDKWTKLDGYAVRCNENGIALSNDGKLLAAADPSNIWKYDGKYYFACGNLLLLDKFRNEPTAPQEYLGDFADVYCSDNLTEWTYCHRLYERDKSDAFTDVSEDCMCPYLGVLSDKNGNDTNTYILLFLAHNRGTQYYLGTFSSQKMYFTPMVHGRMSFVDNCLFAPEAVRAKDGRLIVFNWLRDNMDDDLDRELAKGWAGIHALPREVWLADDGTLGIAPLRELVGLRVGQKICDVAAHENVLLSPVLPQHTEVEMNFVSDGSGKVGLRIYYGKKNFTDIYADFATSQLIVDVTHSGTKGRKVKDIAPLVVQKGTQLRLRVFVDGSVVEVFANDKQAMTRQVFPTMLDEMTFECRNQTINSAIATVYDLSFTTSM